MPTYDYVCAACDHAFEHFQSMTSRRLRKCPSCGKPKLDRLVGSGAGVIFKGSGFYETDYKRAGKGGPKEDKSSAQESGTAKEGAKEPGTTTGAAKEGAKDGAKGGTKGADAPTSGSGTSSSGDAKD